MYHKVFCANRHWVTTRPVIAHIAMDIRFELEADLKKNQFI